MTRKGPYRSAEDGRSSAVDPAEVEKFARHAEEWWDGAGKFRPLHVLNPTRIAIVKAALCDHFGRDSRTLRPFEGLNLLDVGCGGGLIAEPMTRLGASVTGADPSQANIAVARAHAERLGLTIGYAHGDAESLVRAGRSFDVVLALEIVEHTEDPFGFVATLSHLARPGGLVVVSTINRTLAALAFAKIAAEYVLNWVPRGTHRPSRFVKVRELRHAFEASGLKPHPPAGMTYDPFKDEWRRSLDVNINYMMWAERP